MTMTPTILDTPQDVTLDSAWVGKVAAAMQAWDRLGEAELIETGGDQRALSGLIRDRYRLSRSDAFQQAKQFLQRMDHHPAPRARVRF